MIGFRRPVAVHQNPPVGGNRRLAKVRGASGQWFSRSTSIRYLPPQARRSTRPEGDALAVRSPRGFVVAGGVAGGDGAERAGSEVVHPDVGTTPTTDGD